MPSIVKPLGDTVNFTERVRVAIGGLHDLQKGELTFIDHKHVNGITCFSEWQLIQHTGTSRGTSEDDQS